MMKRNFNAHLVHVFDTHTYTLTAYYSIAYKYNTIFFIPGYNFLPVRFVSDDIRQQRTATKKIMPNYSFSMVVRHGSNNILKYPNVQLFKNSTLFAHRFFISCFVLQMPFIGTLPNSSDCSFSIQPQV